MRRFKSGYALFRGLELGVEPQEIIKLKMEFLEAL